ncbi:MAG: DUF6597 domain-containing transcriptional factor [Gemmatimonadales bacterium]
MQRPNAPPPRGILDRNPDRPTPGHRRSLAAADLRPFVEHYWVVRWDQRGLPPATAETLPHPAIHWITEGRKSVLHGVPTGRFVRTIRGLGHVFGVKFRPGGLYPFIRFPVSTFTNRTLPLARAFGTDGKAMGAVLRVLGQRALRAMNEGDEEGDDAVAEMMDLMDRFLLDRHPGDDPQLELVTAVTTAIVADHGITRVEDVTARFGVTLRSLQRLFSKYVGVNPKWMIQRYRLLEALDRIAAGEVARWSRLAAELGYFDQAHFIKDFKALVGRSPAAYATRMRR